MADDVVAYDKAKWHSGGDWPKDLSADQANVHIGFYLAWLIDRGLIGGTLTEDFSDEVKKYKDGKLTGPELLEILDGALVSDMLSDQGNRFSKYYYEEKYMSDYGKQFDGLPSLYHVKDTRQNYLFIKKHIDKAFEEWRSKKD